MQFRALPWHLQSPESKSIPPPKAILPDASGRKNDTTKRLKPVKVVAIPKEEDPPPEAAKLREPGPTEWKRHSKDERARSRALREKERVLMAAGLVTPQRVTRVGTSDDLIFRCPVCSAPTQCGVSDCGGEFPCPSCGAVLFLPDLSASGRIRVVSLPTKKPTAEGLPAIELPAGRSIEGRSHEARFQALDELLPDGEEGALAWGLEKNETVPERQGRAGVWLWFAVPLFLMFAAILVRQLFSSSGRSAGELARTDEMVLVAPSGEINWDALPQSRKYLLVDQRLRAFFEAPDLATKAAQTRGGPASEARMTAYYERKGGYEAETRVHGAVQEIVLQEERIVGGKVFQTVAVRFAKSVQGIYALERTPTGYLVDWEYSEGYGEISFTELAANLPLEPVLMRVHLSETTHFGEGFEEASYRSFNMADPFKEETVPAFVARNSKVEDFLSRAWNDALLDSIGDPSNAGSDELDFVVRVRYENGANRKGFVIDEVLMRGWIMPDKPR